MTDLYRLFTYALDVILVVTILCPLNVPLMRLAFRIWRGSEPMGMEPREVWVRSIWSSLSLFGLSLTVVILSFFLVEVGGLGDAQGPLMLVFFLLYVPAALYALYNLWMLEDLGQALSIFLIYVLVPGLPLLLLAWLSPLGRLVKGLAPWVFPA